MFVELGAVGVDAARGAGECTGDGRGVSRSLTRRDPGAQARGGDRNPHPVAAPQVASRDGRALLDLEVERRAPLVARPELDRRIHDQPDDVALLSLHLAHEQAPSTGARLPCDPLGRVAWDVVAQLAPLAAVL